MEKENGGGGTNPGSVEIMAAKTVCVCDLTREVLDTVGREPRAVPVAILLSSCYCHISRRLIGASGTDLVNIADLGGWMIL